MGPIHNVIPDGAASVVADKTLPAAETITTDSLKSTLRLSFFLMIPDIFPGVAASEAGVSLRVRAARVPQVTARPLVGAQVVIIHRAVTRHEALGGEH